MNSKSSFGRQVDEGQAAIEAAARERPSSVTPLRPVAEFRTTKLRPINKGALAGFFDLDCIGWGIVIKDCKLFRKDGREWVGMPSVSYVNRDNNTVWKDLIEIPDKGTYERFQQAVLRALHSGSNG